MSTGTNRRVNKRWGSQCLSNLHIEIYSGSHRAPDTTDNWPWRMVWCKGRESRWNGIASTSTMKRRGEIPRNPYNWNLYLPGCQWAWAAYQGGSESQEGLVHSMFIIHSFPVRVPSPIGGDEIRADLSLHKECLNNLHLWPSCLLRSQAASAQDKESPARESFWLGNFLCGICCPNLCPNTQKFFENTKSHNNISKITIITKPQHMPILDWVVGCWLQTPGLQRVLSNFLFIVINFSFQNFPCSLSLM